ncbi:enoyl-CoA hydratase 2, peroxisomal [Physcomitrium patens]|uniref:Uncharacterized protein n=1 Tax=Physcomitrium patens TaxID=3218 RepID=A0A2K1KPW5_PHYPA|nr:enoyl-CoA hydratase 2, peroxisomal-like [Physcomitrium patens]PNR55786.1 hypothetical protein PHYPA_006683 [Physcomitrium patens]|eukprot:XP_024374517.1 enoyl-CoA hydratase 2, peroxisomal-like [Physcomitrella patens]
MASLPRIDPAQVLAHEFPESLFTYTERDVALYALGVGAASSDPCDPSELSYVYHPDGQSSIKVLPTFTVLYPVGFLDLIGSISGLHYDPKLLLHGEQYIEVYQPIPVNATIRNNIRIAGLHDKGKAAVVELETVSHNDDTGALLCMNRSTIFLRGAGGFSTSEIPFSFSNRTSLIAGVGSRTAAKKDVSAGGTSPDRVFEDHTHPSQALLYRLNGDYNPLHADPSFAKKAGFPQPILHGLCTLGFATKAVVTGFCGGDPSNVQSVQGRFLLHVFPGETLVTEMWKDEGQNRVDYKLKVKERNKVVLSGSIILRSTLSRL